MAVGRIWYWPDELGTVETVDFDHQLSEADWLPRRHRVDAETVAGRRWMADHGAAPRVRVECRFTDADQRIALECVQDHLQRGGYIGLAAHSDRAWCGYLRTLPRRGDTSLDTGGNVWHTSGTGTITSGDVLALESANPAAMHQLVTESGGTSSGFGAAAEIVGLSGSVLKTYDQGPVWARHELYWPALQLPDDQLSRPLLTSDGRLRWTFTAELAFNLDVMARMESFSATSLALGAAELGGKTSLEKALVRREFAGTVGKPQFQPDWSGWRRP
jgi:hypothetical protein